MDSAENRSAPGDDKIVGEITMMTENETRSVGQTEVGSKVSLRSKEFSTDNHADPNVAVSQYDGANEDEETASETNTQLVVGSKLSIRSAQPTADEQIDLNALLMESESEMDNEDWYDASEDSHNLDEFLKRFDDDQSHVQVPENRDIREKYDSKIISLRTEMETAVVPQYLDEFEENIKDDVVLLAPVSIGEIQEEERRLREEHVAYTQYLSEQQQELKKEIAEKEETAKERLLAELRRQKQDIARREALLGQREKIYQERLQNAFRKSESQLSQALDERKGEIKSFYGDLTFADDQYGGSKGRRWRVEWSKTPQPIQVKLKCLRGLRDKIPGGRYVVMVSLYDRLGGHVMRWSKLPGQQWGGCTLPVYHDGKYSSGEISLDQSVFTVVPSKDQVRPGMMLIFELFLLRGAVTPTDRVVAWACFPICDGQFDVVQGYYKSPMLRGHIDTRIDRHGLIEELIASDLDHWLANIYFQIIRLPRYLSGQKEYEVELQFTSGLLSFPDRIDDAEEAIDGESAPDRSDEVSVSGIESTRSVSNMSIRYTSRKETNIVSSSEIKSNFFSDETKNFQGIRYRRKSSLSVSRKETKLGYADSSDDQYSDEESETKSRYDGKFMSIKNETGMYYKIHSENPVEEYNARNKATLIPHTSVLDAKPSRPKLTHLEDLERHTFAVQKPFSTKGQMQSTGHERADYVRRMFLSEMGFAQWRTRDFWITILLLALLWFVRLYVHYCGQWIFLQAISIPVNAFVFYPYTVDLNYQADLLTTGEVIGIVVLGPATNILLLVIFVLVSWLSQMTIGAFPPLFSKFIMAYAIWTTFDPIAILIVDSALGRYQFSATVPIGDAYKLYWHFYTTQGSGVIGVPLTIYLYALVIFTSVVVLYLYFLKLHNNGRMLDIFHRLHGEDGMFFVPFDLEISIQELGYIVKKAEQWRGADGERRKVTVYDYIWGEEIESEDDEVITKKEITTHVSIHTLHLDGLRELYRHFLRLPSGAIVEILGELGSTKLMPDIKTALLKRATSVENFFSEGTSSARLTRSIVGSVSMGDFEHKKNSLGVPLHTEHESDGHAKRPASDDSENTRKTTIVKHTDESSNGGSHTLKIPTQGASDA